MSVSGPTVAFLGMTHLGVVSAAAAASKGFETLAVDPDAALIARLRQGALPVSEPGLDDMVRAQSARLRFESGLGALSRADVVYVAPDAPTDDAGRSDLSGLQALLAAAIPHLSEAAVLVILSQVPPGFTRGVAFPAARRFCQVETLVFGRAVERATEPERIIIGAEDPTAPLPAAYAAFLASFDCPLLPMGYESAELAKISINMCLLASISVANSMAEICEAIGADWAEIAPALKLDRRIGQHAYLAPGLGVAGGNLERDMATVIGLSERHETDAGVVRAWIANSRWRRDWAARLLERTLSGESGDPLIAVWGLAYKENTHATKNSPSIATLERFPARRFRAHDPQVAVSAARHPRIAQAATPLEAAEGAAALMILTPWPEYRAVDLAALAQAMTGRVLIDPYRIVEPAAARAAGFEHHTLGRRPDAPHAPLQAKGAA